MSNEILLLCLPLIAQIVFANVLEPCDNWDGDIETWLVKCLKCPEEIIKPLLEELQLAKQSDFDNLHTLGSTCDYDGLVIPFNVQNPVVGEIHSIECPKCTSSCTSDSILVKPSAILNPSLLHTPCAAELSHTCVSPCEDEGILVVPSTVVNPSIYNVPCIDSSPCPNPCHTPNLGIPSAVVNPTIGHLPSNEHLSSCALSCSDNILVRPSTVLNPYIYDVPCISLPPCTNICHEDDSLSKPYAVITPVIGHIPCSTEKSPCTCSSGETGPIKPCTISNPFIYDVPCTGHIPCVNEHLCSCSDESTFLKPNCILSPYIYDVPGKLFHPCHNSCHDDEVQQPSAIFNPIIGHVPYISEHTCTHPCTDDASLVSPCVISNPLIYHTPCFDNNFACQDSHDAFVDQVFAVLNPVIYSIPSPADHAGLCDVPCNDEYSYEIPMAITNPYTWNVPHNPDYKHTCDTSCLSDAEIENLFAIVNPLVWSVPCAEQTCTCHNPCHTGHDFGKLHTTSNPYIWQVPCKSDHSHLCTSTCYPHSVPRYNISECSGAFKQLNTPRNFYSINANHQNVPISVYNAPSIDDHSSLCQESCYADVIIEKLLEILNPTTKSYIWDVPNTSTCANTCHKGDCGKPCSVPICSTPKVPCAVDHSFTCPDPCHADVILEKLMAILNSGIRDEPSNPLLSISCKHPKAGLEKPMARPNPFKCGVSHTNHELNCDTSCHTDEYHGKLQAINKHNIGKVPYVSRHMTNNALHPSEASSCIVCDSQSRDLPTLPNHSFACKHPSLIDTDNYIPHSKSNVKISNVPLTKNHLFPTVSHNDEPDSWKSFSISNHDGLRFTDTSFSASTISATNPFINDGICSKKPSLTDKANILQPTPKINPTSQYNLNPSTNHDSLSNVIENISRGSELKPSKISLPPKPLTSNSIATHLSTESAAVGNVCPTTSNYNIGSSLITNCQGIGKLKNIGTDFHPLPTLSPILESLFPDFKNIKCLNGYGPNALAASKGDELIVKSVSPMAPHGVETSTSITCDGPVSVCGKIPFLGAVSLEGNLPSVGSGGVSYNCGCDEICMLSEYNTSDPKTQDTISRCNGNCLTK